MLAVSLASWHRQMHTLNSQCVPYRQDLLDAARAGGPLSVLQDSRQGGPRKHRHVARVFAWIAGYLRPKELQALSSLALFRCALSGAK